jgi:hypothetical protein
LWLLTSNGYSNSRYSILQKPIKNGAWLCNKTSDFDVTHGAEFVEFGFMKLRIFEIEKFNGNLFFMIP